MAKTKKTLKRDSSNELVIIEERSRLLKKLEDCEVEFERINKQFKKVIKYIKQDINEVIEELIEDIDIDEE